MASSSHRETPPLAPGHRLDGYELLWPIGEGGMASVWVARLTRKHGFEKLVAIKTILPKFAEDESFQKMFLDEARIASRIDHANVAHIHDLGEKDDVLYLVMEYVDGDALTRLRKVLIKKGIPFPVGVALRVMADVCSGLHAAHELKGADGKPLGVVHRDVSPQNVLITTDGASKLIDFGVAKAAGRLTEETHTGYVKGKVQYMAPEQALGKNVDRRADLWAVGAVIYHLIANRPPFEADNQLALLSLLQRGRPPAPLPPSVPAPVADLIKKALTHNAAQRFQTALEMRAAIEKSGLAATTEEVASFVTMHLGELAARRRQAITTALQKAEAFASARAADALVPEEANASTQRIDPKDLPFLPQPAASVSATGRLPSEPRIGPPTPQSFPVVANTMRPRSDPRLMTTPLAAPIVPPPAPPLLPPSQPNPMVPAAFGSQPHLPARASVPSQPGTHPAYPIVPSGLTEPLPSIEAYEAATNENTNGGSLGLASISASVNARSPRGTPWLAIGIGSAVLLLLVIVGVGFGMRAARVTASDKHFDPQFSPLPSASIATTAPATPITTPAPPPATAVPSEEPATPIPTDSATAATEPTSTTAPALSHSSTARPLTTGGVPVKPPTAPAGSGKKKPRIDDGF